MAVVGGRINPATGRPRLPVFGGGLDWSPFYLGTSLLGFWDAEEATTFTLSGASVTTWADRVGGYAPTQATAGNKPTYSATSFNGRPGVTLDGVDDYLELAPVPATFPIGSASCEIWILANQTALVADTTARAIFGYGTSLAGRQISRTVATLNRPTLAVGNGSAVAGVTDGAVDFSGIHVIRARVGNLVASIAMDGGAGASRTDTVPATTSTILRIGAVENPSPSNYFQGSINAIIVTAALTADQAAQMTVYLKARGSVP